jgi:hypothetical protein
LKNTAENIFDKIHKTTIEQPVSDSKGNPIDVLEEVSKLFYGIEYTTESELNKMVKKLVSKVPSNEIDMACLKLIDQNRIESIQGVFRGQDKSERVQQSLPFCTQQERG